MWWVYSNTCLASVGDGSGLGSTLIARFGYLLLAGRRRLEDATAERSEGQEDARRPPSPPRGDEWGEGTSQMSKPSGPVAAHDGSNPGSPGGLERVQDLSRDLHGRTHTIRAGMVMVAPIPSLFGPRALGCRRTGS